MSEEPYAKVAKSVIRIVAFAIIMAGFFLAASDLFLYLSHRPLPGVGTIILHGLPILLGIVLFGKSGALAERLTRDLD